MLVKKINPEWRPKENEALKVGDTIDMTDPKDLILRGDAVAIDSSTGAEISAFELYGIVVDREFEEFKKWQQQQSQERQAEKLKKEQEELQAKIKEKIAEDVKAGVTTDTIKTEEKKEDVVEAPKTEKKKVDDSVAWGELMAQGKELGVFKVGMKKEELITAINNA